jgi:hypothetical protein
MVKQNSSGQDYTNATDGFTIGGGITERILTVTGGNPTITASGTNVYTMPAATDTLLGRASVDTLTNKTISSASNTFAFGVNSQTNAGTAGGTMYYINLGGIKMLWGQTAAKPVTTAAGYTVTFPSSFFLSIQSLNATVSNNSGVANIYASIDTVTTTSCRLIITDTAGTATNATISFSIIGT